PCLPPPAPAFPSPTRRSSDLLKHGTGLVLLLAVHIDDSRHNNRLRLFPGFRQVFLYQQNVQPLLHESSRSFPRYSRSSRRITERSEEHTSELQSRFDLVCRLL